MQKLSFEAEGETLDALVVGDTPPSALYLHGAGKATKERGLPIMEHLAEAGLSTFAFDFSGHGASTGLMEQSSLKKRVKEAEAALPFLDRTKPITVIGSSMGGHVSLELLKRHPEINNVALFYSAVYSAEAFDVPFTEAFSEIIRQPKSWERNDVLDALERYEGNLLIVAGELDQVVPREVTDLIYTSAEHALKREVIVIPGAEHLLLPVLMENKELFDAVINKIIAGAK